MYVGICEDDAEQMLALIKLIEAQPSPVPVQILQFATLEQLEQSVKKPDILFLDIEVGNQNSIAYLSQSSKLSTVSIIVLVSSHAHYITSSFTIPVSQFLLKPILPELFAKVFAGCYKQYMLLQQCCEVTSAQGVEHLLPLRTMAFIKSERRILTYTDITNNTYTGTESLQSIYQKLQPFGFCQIHKSYLVNMALLVSLTEQEATLRLQNKSIILPVGKKYADTAKQQYLQYLAEKGEN
jgi:DNA-binding LytR/AlgR family response regulator